ncbi:MAG: prepilin-type N-terminal cleavage/methylation domain-containing protein [Candidatus Veblenbacteria bacterium]|nr:prepilin-type N-terminal cleavage/methylation domain-containing protein [Candidatus Veblenbacteria bacterium]MDZ4230108.1 prepilin-type N-terminal cleavage/methylation domain-containing protein [Candidatus Veblenbacteria bacterium]
MLTHDNKSLPKGFTLVELLVVISIFIIIASLSLYLGFDMYRGYAWHAEQTVLVSVLQKARGQAMANLCLGSGCTNGRPHGVALLPDKYIIFQGASYATRDAGLDEVFEVSPIVGRSPSTAEVVFGRLGGESGGITITLTDPVRSGTISVNAEGRISW